MRFNRVVSLLFLRREKMKEQTCHQFLLQHSAYADVLEKTHSKETEWAKHHKPYEKAMPIRKKFTAKLKDKES